MKFFVVGIEYFTKWVEAEPLAKITQKNVKTSSGRTLCAGLECLGY